MASGKDLEFSSEQELADLGDHPRNEQREETRGRNSSHHLARHLFGKDSLDRRLERHHITSIAFGGTIGIGMFVTSGQLIALSGSAGCVISFAVAGLIVIAVMRTLAEMVSVRPLSGALIDFPHTFVDRALGFAVGVTYTICQCLSMAALTSASARLADNFTTDGNPLDEKAKAGVIVGLLIVTLLSNVCGVKLYGRLERFVKWLKYILIVGVCVLMIVIQAGVGENEQKGNSYTRNAVVPYFRFAGFTKTSQENYGDGNQESGIPGDTGKFLAVSYSMFLAMFACMGGDIVIVTAGEAKSPRRDLAPATQFMYLVPIACYIVGSFLVGLNVDYLELKLFRPFARENQETSHSPFVIAVESAKLHALPAILKAGFLFSAYTAANTGLYSASRSLFAVAQLYGNDFVRETLRLGKTNNGKTPVPAIICCSLFGLLAFLGLADKTYNQPILTLSSFFVSTLGCIYISECIAFLRFKKGLTILDSNESFSRDSELYKSRHYRAHWQPLCAIFGIVGCGLIVIFSGWPAIYLLANYDEIKPENSIKEKKALAGDVLGAYVGPLLFVTLFLSYKVRYSTRFRRFIDFKDAYFLPKFDSQERLQRPKGAKGWAKEIWSFFK